MKVLQVNSVYKKGSTGKIVYDIHQCLQDEKIDSVVCYGRGETMREQNIYKFCSEIESKIYHLFNLFGWLMYAVCPVATKKLIKIIKKERPDIVHLHCINGFCVNIYSLLKFLGRSNIKTVVTHHAEFFYTGSCGHAFECQKFQSKNGCFKCPILHEATGSLFFDKSNKAWKSMKESFCHFKKENLVFTAVSPWVLNRSSLSPICNKFRCICIKNGVETRIFSPSKKSELNKLKERITLSDKKIVLHVAANFSTEEGSFKGGHYIRELAEQMQDYQFIVVASKIISTIGLPKNVFVWGQTNDQQELATLYFAADVTVIASKRETFSMITAESLCCGTPVVGFEAGGPESIGIKNFSAFVKYGDLNSLKKQIEIYVNKNYDSKLISMQAQEVYSKEVMSKAYISLYKDLLK